MKNLGKRSLTGLIYVATLVACIMINKYTFALLFVVILSFTMYEFFRLCQKIDAKPQVILGILVGVAIFSAAFFNKSNVINSSIYFSIFPLLMLIPVIELFRKKENPLLNTAITFTGIIYIAIPFSILNFIVFPSDHNQGLFSGKILLGILILIWTYDTAAYITGVTLGKHKLMKRISPKKSWEGAIGGTIVTLLTAIFLTHSTKEIKIIDALIIGIITVVFGTFGDLSESMLKRTIGIKDSGNILPGHGGLLDRFDSLLFVAPAVYAYISLVINK